MRYVGLQEAEFISLVSPKDEYQKNVVVLYGEGEDGFRYRGAGFFFRNSPLMSYRKPCKIN